jgi:hypothetical protein
MKFCPKKGGSNVDCIEAARVKSILALYAKQPWSKILLEHLMVAQLVTKFSASYETRI